MAKRFFYKKMKLKQKAINNVCEKLNVPIIDLSLIHI